MSLKGKKKAILKCHLDYARNIIDLILHPYGFLLHPSHTMTHEMILRRIQSTPENLFKDDGTIDKRKSKRHNRKTKLIGKSFIVKPKSITEEYNDD